MDSGLGSDDEKKNRTKAQKQLQNEQKQLFSSCFIDATSLGDEGECEHRRNDERRQGALLFRSSIPQYSMLQMPHAATQTDRETGPDLQQEDEGSPRQLNHITTPHNSFVQLDASVAKKTPVGFYVDLGDVEVTESPPPTAPIEKKNIFSMIIDFNVPKREMPTRLSTSLYGKRKTTNASSKNTSDSGSQSYEAASCSSCDKDATENASSGFHDNVEENQSDNSMALPPCSDIQYENASNFSSDVILPPSTPPPPIEDEKENGEEALTQQQQQEEEEEGGDDDIITNKTKDNNTKDKTTAISQQFVKLSDLEEQSPKLDLFMAPRMSRSIPEKSWVESPLATFRSASYRSSPQPFQPESYEPSEAESLTESSSLPPRRSAQRLGTDLLRMFLEEIGPDIIVEVNGRRLKAHRCILSSRCHYFAAVLGGNFTENVISIQGYSYAAVHFAMCHIYSGAAHVPQSISLVELAALADMLGLEGLKEVVAHALKLRHCHNFHSPCAGCITGVVEVLPLTATYGLDELYQSCLRWITRHFIEVWPNRTFVSLPRELREKCYQQHVVHMAPDTVLETTTSCDRLLASMPTAKWAESVAQLTLQLADYCQIYLRQHYPQVLSSSSFQSFDTRLNRLSQVEESLVSTAGSLKLDPACRAYIHCHKMLQKTWGTHFSNVLRKIYVQLENCIARQINQASRSSIWMQLDPVLRRRIRDLNAASAKKQVRTTTPVRTPPKSKSDTPGSHTLSSSSDSSRNSSPAIKSAHRIQAPSPSLRRSLLMAAARSSQTPTSPSLSRRAISTLTNPTQSSAAKNAARNMSGPATTTTQKAIVNKPIASPKRQQQQQQQQQQQKGRVSREALLQRRAVPQKTAATTSKKPAAPATTKSQMASTKKTVASLKQKTTNVMAGPKQVVVSAERTEVKKSPTVRRSGTFLKDEPTVLGKMTTTT